MRLKVLGDVPSGAVEVGRLAEHGFAGGEEVLEGFFEVAGVPGVGYVAADAGNNIEFQLTPGKYKLYLDLHEYNFMFVKQPKD